MDAADAKHRRLARRSGIALARGRIRQRRFLRLTWSSCPGRVVSGRAAAAHARKSAARGEPAPPRRRRSRAASTTSSTPPSSRRRRAYIENDALRLGYAVGGAALHGRTRAEVRNIEAEVSRRRARARDRHRRRALRFGDRARRARTTTARASPRCWSSRGSCAARDRRAPCASSRS